MPTHSARRVVWISVAAASATALVALYAGRLRVLETWYAYGLSSESAETRIVAAEKLTGLRTVRSAERIEAFLASEQDAAVYDAALGNFAELLTIDDPRLVAAVERAWKRFPGMVAAIADDKTG